MCHQSHFVVTLACLWEVYNLYSDWASLVVLAYTMDYWHVTTSFRIKSDLKCGRHGLQYISTMAIKCYQEKLEFRIGKKKNRIKKHVAEMAYIMNCWVPTPRTAPSRDEYRGHLHLSPWIWHGQITLLLHYNSCCRNWFNHH